MRFAAIAFLVAPAAAAQTPAAPPRCEAPVYRAFDFWVGRWDVFNPKGEKVGENIVSREEAGCLIVERWSSAKGNSGQSYNFYDPSRDQWRQIWVSPAELTDYAGGLNAAGEMVMEGDLQQASGYAGRSRGTWTANPDGTVRQRFETFDPKTGWVESFNGLYRRKN
jgi:hypothetical protein